MIEILQAKHVWNFFVIWRVNGLFSVLLGFMVHCPHGVGCEKIHRPHGVNKIVYRGTIIGSDKSWLALDKTVCHRELFFQTSSCFIYAFV
jgi:hypothetical protein